MEQLALLALTVLALVIHGMGVISGFLVMRKYEDRFKNLDLFGMFKPCNFCAQRLWFILLSVVVSIGYFILASQLFVEIHAHNFSQHTVKYVMFNMAVGILIVQYGYFMLKDRRS